MELVVGSRLLGECMCSITWLADSSSSTQSVRARLALTPTVLISMSI